MIEYSGNHTDWLLNDLCEKYKHSDYKILIFEWWDWIELHPDVNVDTALDAMNTSADKIAHT